MDQPKRRRLFVPDPLCQLTSHPIGSSTVSPSHPLEDERWARVLALTQDDSDKRLLERCGQDDEDAWRLLVLRYQNLVYSTALNVGLEPDDAGDVFQEVWIELHRSIPRIRSPEALPRWLIVATRRLSYKVATRKRRLVAEVSKDLVDPATLPDELVEATKRRMLLDAALDRMGGRCEKLLRLLFFESDKLPYDEISKRTGLAIGSIGPIRARCLTRLRRLLEGTT